ncbi:PKD domain-containing protein [Paraflavitalea pollutisoli]|uniref:PKD domain-containing protein n=1 Tax=Paraflavitalea pollutisoli TaxID=3034143 RepID=UPI0023EBA9B9|nr:T9SS type A sorting domain-containing protein [Paraflavitalea sp. H1-2-19X]
MKTSLLMVCLFVCLYATAQQVEKSLIAANGQRIGFLQYTPTDYNPRGPKYPLIIFLHGRGQIGNGTTQLAKVKEESIPRYISEGLTMRFYWNGKWQTFLVLSPQLSNSSFWYNFYTEEMIKYAKANLNVDTNRISLMGLSQGGGGVWDFAAGSVTNGRMLNAIATSAPTCQSNDYCKVANADLPLWASHAKGDPVTQANCTEAIVNSINGSCGGAVKAYMSMYTGSAHNAWNKAFSYDNSQHNPNVYEWLLGQDRSKPINIRPRAVAGSNITISSSTGYAFLSGARSSDPDGHIERYVWKQIAGPITSTVVTPVSTHGNTRINRLTTAGTYTYELTAIDDRADWVTATVNINVVAGTTPNIPPITEAGDNQTIEYGSATLHGGDSYDPDGTTLSYKWTKLSGPATITFSNDAVANPDITNLLVGTYQLQLETTDALGAKTTDFVSINSSAVLLPTQLSFFKGTAGNGHTLLTWATAQEEDNDHFDIERSLDGKQYTTIGKIPGAGRSSTLQPYSFSDQQSPVTTTYYRLKLVNAQGVTRQYSAVIRIAATPTSTVLEYYPNPVKDQLTLQLNHAGKGQLQVRVLSLDGRLIRQQQQYRKEGLSTLQLETKSLKPGIYLLEVSMGDQLHEIRKFVKQ